MSSVGLPLEPVTFALMTFPFSSRCTNTLVVPLTPCARTSGARSGGTGDASRAAGALRVAQGLTTLYAHSCRGKPRDGFALESRVDTGALEVHPTSH